MQILEIRSGQGHNDPRMAHATPSSEDASTHRIWDS